MLTSAAGFALASTASIDYAVLVSAMIGIALLSSGIATLNQYMERDLDAAHATHGRSTVAFRQTLPGKPCVWCRH